VLKRPSAAAKFVPAPSTPPCGRSPTLKAGFASPLFLTAGDAVLKRPAKARTEVSFEQFSRDMEVDNIVRAQLDRKVRPAPCTPPCARSPNIRSGFASPVSHSGVNMSGLLGAGIHAPNPQAPPRPKSWSSSKIVEEEALPKRRCIRRPTEEPPDVSPPLLSGRPSKFLQQLLRDTDKKAASSKSPCSKAPSTPPASWCATEASSRKAPSTPPVLRPPASPCRDWSRDELSSDAVSSVQAPFNSSPSKNMFPVLSSHSQAADVQDKRPVVREAAVDTRSSSQKLADEKKRLASRMGEVKSTAARISAVKKACYTSEVEWGFVVLGKPQRDVHSVQKAYRTLMRPLHPDRAGSLPEAAAAVDLLREAKDLCEKSLRYQNAPDRPTRLTCTHLCSAPTL